ncbi:MAG: PDZ domain-containing protein [Gordonia sp. (in: high G+C Gram-positive bacteria)]
MSLNPQNRRMATIGVALVILVVFVVLGTTARVPYVALSPGPTVNTLGKIAGTPVVTVTGAVDPDPKGHLNLTTVSLSDGMTLFQAIGMWFSGNYQLQPRDLYFPPDKSEDDVRKENTAQMSSSEDNAIGAALTYLKLPTAVAVAGVSDDSPASGKLKPGDVLVAVGDKQVKTFEDVQAAVRAHKPGEVVPVEVNRDGTVQTIDVKLGARPDDKDAAFLGVTSRLTSADPKIKIDFNVGDIGGPSAGLMMALAVIDKMTPGDLSRGKFIAGTGTIDPSGEVGVIGGITHKLKAAKEAGATAFLVPAGNCKEASSDAPDGLELVKVGTLTDAVDALGEIGTDKKPAHC